MGVCNCSMFCCTLLYVHSSIAIILMGERELIALLNLSSWCLVMVERLFLEVPRGCLQFVIVVFPDHTHLLFLMQYTWHSHHKPPIFCRLDYFLISENLRNSIVSSRHNIGYKSDHKTVSLNIDLINLTRGPGYFKLNNSILLNEDYQEIIKNSIIEIADINKEGNPNTKWELIKGSVRNETIKYATYKKKETIKQEKKP